MNIFSKLLEKFKPSYDVFDEEDDSFIEPEKTSFDHSNLPINNRFERRKYIEGCLEQMRDAALKVEELNGEYEVVNSYLKDMEVVESLEGDDLEVVSEHAKAITLLNIDRNALKERQSYMDEADFRRMERLGDEVVDAIEKLNEAEAYQGKIKRDLSRLEAEKQAYRIRIEEAKTLQVNIRGMSIICLISAVTCVIILLILQFMLEMDATIGYLIMAVMVALLLTAMFVKFKDADRELKVSSINLNKVILLQNTVKIRYVNNTNLLDYLYLKYNVSGGKKLSDLWEKFQVEKREREKLEETESDYSFHGEQMIRTLKKYRLYDPSIWIRQAEAILDHREMVEIRHTLILRRQNLRKQTDYNKQTAAAAKEEIMTLAKEYPAYAEEIMEMLTQKL